MSNIIIRYKTDYNTVFTELTVPKIDLLKLFQRETIWFTGQKPVARMATYQTYQGAELRHVHPERDQYDVRFHWFVRDGQIIIPDMYGEVCLPKETTLIGKHNDYYVYLLPPTIHANVIFTLRMVALHSNGQPFPGELIKHDQLFEIMR